MLCHNLNTNQVLYYKCTRHRRRYCLSVVFMFDREQDEYFFSYSYPYTYTDLQRFLHNLEAMELPYMRRELLGRTIQHRRLDLVVISSKENLQRFQMDRHSSFENQHVLNLVKKYSALADSQPHKGGKYAGEQSGSQRRRHRPTPGERITKDESVARHSNIESIKCVFITARVHPGETPASWICHGILEFLLSNNPAARCLRDHIIFYIIPMLNPDGVAIGNYRTSSLGFDLNRHWINPERWSQPTICLVKSMLMALGGDPKIDLDYFIDIHAHTTAQNGFMYTNSIIAGGRQELFPRLLDEICPQFAYDKCKATTHAYKQGTGRRAMGSFLSVCGTMCYTFEVTNTWKLCLSRTSWSSLIGNTTISYSPPPGFFFLFQWQQWRSIHTENIQGPYLSSLLITNTYVSSDPRPQILCCLPGNRKQPSPSLCPRIQTPGRTEEIRDEQYVQKSCLSQMGEICLSPSFYPKSYGPCDTPKWRSQAPKQQIRSIPTRGVMTSWWCEHKTWNKIDCKNFFG